MTRLRELFQSFKTRKGRVLNSDNLSFNSFGHEGTHDQFPITRESSLNSHYETNKQEGRNYVKFSPENVKLSDCTRPSLATILLIALMATVFIILPLIFFMDCFGYFRPTEQSMFKRVLKEQDHYAPSDRLHELLNQQTVKSTNSNSLRHTTSHISEEISPLPPPPPPDDKQCTLVTDGDRLDCYPSGSPGNANSETCADRGCCWAPTTTTVQGDGGAPPYCYYPRNYDGYRYVNVSETAFGLEAFLRRDYASSYEGDLEFVQMIVKFETSDRLRIKFIDPNKKRFETPYPEVPIIDIASTNLSYSFVLNKIHSGFTVVRKSDNTTIFDSMNLRNMIYSSQFLQFSTKLPSDKIYGLGEHRSNLQLSTNWQKFTLFNHDGVPEKNRNLYGSHPFYLSLENSNKANGVLLLSSNAMEILLQPGPVITYRTLGGILDFFIVLGPSPSDVLKQYQDIIGLPFMPPYWSLGFHLCRFGYKTLEDTKQVLKRNLDAGILIETQWNDLDYMNNSNDFTYDHINYKGLPQFVMDLHKSERHYIPIIDPGISGSEKAGEYLPYDKGIELDIFVKNSTGDVFIGKVWNSGITVWPDFTNPAVVNYWTLMLRSLHDQVPFDGAWIDMNEPANFLTGSTSGCPKNNNLEQPAYKLEVEGGVLAYKTFCMTAQHYEGLHYDVHNLYGISEAVVTTFALAEIRGKRPFVISRSTFPGHGHFAGHWSGDVYSKWEDMQYSIPQMLSYSLFGIPVMGADICGFNGNTTVELCNRWHQLGAFYPFSRNHNTDNGNPQDPAALGDLVIKSTKKAFNVRYALLPYLYTLFWAAHTRGDTVARPLFFEFPSDTNTHTIDTQFLWGAALMILPVLHPHTTTLDAYMPAGVWYDYYSYAPLLVMGDGGARVNISAPLDTIPVLVRGGHVVPRQTVGETTAARRRSGLEVLAAGDDRGAGWGELYWDDGDTMNTYQEDKYSLIEFTLSTGRFVSSAKYWGPETPPNLVLVTILGVLKPVTQVTVNDVYPPFEYNTVNKSLTIADLDLSLADTIVITWK